MKDNLLPSEIKEMRQGFQMVINSLDKFIEQASKERCETKKQCKEEKSEPKCICIELGNNYDRDCPIHGKPKDKECEHEFTWVKTNIMSLRYSAIYCHKCKSSFPVFRNIKPKDNGEVIELAKIIRVYSGWDIGEESCIRIAEEAIKHGYRKIGGK